jgi:hypothetical protein
MSCPYGPPSNFSENDLNMRRKAEILKYKHGNQLTKAQRYSLAARGKLTKKKAYATQSETFTNPNTLNIPKTNNTLTVPSQGIIYSTNHESDVPGGTQLLYLDNTKPLYMYRKRQYTFSMNNTINQNITDCSNN